MPERRTEERPNSRDRRSFPRPPLWLNLLLLVLALATFGYAKHQHDEIHTRTAILFAPTPANPADLNRLRDELSQMDLTEQQLRKEFDARAEYLKTIRGTQFYISVDTAKKKLYLRLGSDVAREADITLGEGRTVKARDKSWTFVPVKGAFPIIGKQAAYAWTVPEWVYAMRGEAVPAQRPQIPDGLGKYVLVLPDNYVIHTPPPEGSPLHGMTKPGSIMVSEADMAAIWPRILPGQTRVYIF